jgi:lipopolysaccharide transport system ATP-binding protein
MALAIRVENLSKQYRLGQIGTGTLSHDLNRFWASIRGKEDPYAQIGAANDRSQKANNDYVWALKDINFDIEQGDALGIIGRNGAGKSTLLKILSRTTLPTTGSVKMKGRIASLLEVGTGFHPEMTGRENIFQNGAILGMTRHEITRKFDEIVDFSGCEAYIDTPVKRYSSGMYVRLAFAVAAHLESEILIVDEVLAVGDAEFQKKCLGKMNDVAKGEGRTVLFVSHDMGAITKLCNKGIHINNGFTKSVGLIGKVVEDYIFENLKSHNFEPNRFKDIYLDKIKVNNLDLLSSKSFEKISFNLDVYSNFVKDDVYVGIGINDKLNNRIFTPFSMHINKKYKLANGLNKINCIIDKFPLKPGVYYLEIYIGDGYTVFDYYNKSLTLEINAGENIPLSILPNESQGQLIIEQNWD